MSGVLPRNRRKLEDGIASTIEREWLTPERIGLRLGEMDLVGRLGSFLTRVRLDEVLGREGFERLVQRVVDYLSSPDMPRRVDALVEKVLPRSAGRLKAMIARFGLRRASSAAASSLRERLPRWREDRELLDTIESAIHEFGDQLRDPDSAAREFAQRVMDTIVRETVSASRGEITLMVKENLSKMSDEQIRRQIESKTRIHLDWIRVNGGIFGALFGLMFAMSRIVANHGAAILAHLQRL
ncbi:MAG TPA: DUF445 family protein, partial [Candidatus Binataceae bacterium]|nr:DUF445 family protein [Candidatus Binataceae bacterium]